MTSFCYSVPRVVFFALASSLALPALAQSFPAPREPLECIAAQKLAYPASDRPTLEQVANLQDCDAERLYYGLDGPANPLEARLCALSPGNEDSAQEAGILMMLYANGVGVTRDFSLAKKAACVAGGSPMELRGRLRHLREMEEGKAGAAPIDICDDIASGFMQGICADIQSELASKGRVVAMASLTANWSAAKRQAFERFKEQFDGFVTARSNLEIDQSGTARAALLIEEERLRQDELLEELRQFEAGRLPRFSAEEYARLDRELNLTYRDLLSVKADDSGTVTKKAVREAQRHWLRYREAWVTFGTISYPGTTAAVWRGLATEKRIAMLKTLRESWD